MLAGHGSDVNLEAGMELLEYYQKCWRDIHSKTEEMAANAQVILLKIQSLALSSH